MSHYKSATEPRIYLNPLEKTVYLPDLIEIQKNSYNWFLRQAIKELFDEITPIKDYTGRELELSFTDYYLDEPKFDEQTSKAKNVTFEAPLRAVARLTNR